MDQDYRHDDDKPRNFDAVAICCLQNLESASSAFGFTLNTWVRFGAPSIIILMIIEMLLSIMLCVFPLTHVVILFFVNIVMIMLLTSTLISTRHPNKIRLFQTFAILGRLAIVVKVISTSYFILWTSLVVKDDKAFRGTTEYKDKAYGPIKPYPHTPAVFCYNMYRYVTEVPGLRLKKTFPHDTGVFNAVVLLSFTSVVTVMVVVTDVALHSFMAITFSNGDPSKRLQWKLNIDVETLPITTTCDAVVRQRSAVSKSNRESSYSHNKGSFLNLQNMEARVSDQLAMESVGGLLPSVESKSHSASDGSQQEAIGIVGRRKSIGFCRRTSGTSLLEDAVSTLIGKLYSLENTLARRSSMRGAKQTKSEDDTNDVSSTEKPYHTAISYPSSKEKD